MGSLSEQLQDADVVGRKIGSDALAAQSATACHAGEVRGHRIMGDGVQTVRAHMV